MFVLLVICMALIFLISLIQSNKEVIKIGVSEALTGNYAVIGNDIAKGINDAFADIDSKKMFGKKVKLLMTDNQADPKKAVTDYQLFKAEGINIIMSAFSGVAGALNPLSKEDGKIFVHLAATPQFAKDNEYAIKVYSDIEKEAKLIVQKIISDDITKKDIGIAFVSNPTTELLLEQFKELLPKFSRYSFTASDNDFRTIITKMKSDKIKSVVLLGYSNQDLLFLRAIG